MKYAKVLVDIFKTAPKDSILEVVKGSINYFPDGEDGDEWWISPTQVEEGNLEIYPENFEIYSDEPPKMIHQVKSLFSDNWLEVKESEVQSFKDMNIPTRVLYKV